MTTFTKPVGFYDLPVPIAVSRDVLGSTCATKIADIATEVRAPLPHPQTDYPATAPILPGVPPNNSKINNPYDWAITFAGNYTEEYSTYVRRLGVVFQNSGSELANFPEGRYSPSARISLTAVQGLDEWFDHLRTWIEVLTGQDLDYRHPVFDAYYPGDGFHRWEGGAWLTKELPEINLRDITPVSLENWKLALKKSGNQIEPPLEQILARDARAAFRRGDFRRASIDIGTTSEILMNRLYRANIDVLNGAGLTIMIQGQRNLRSLKNALTQAGIPLNVSDEQIDDLINARNSAAHEGHEISKDKLEPCLTTMMKLLKSHGEPLY